MDIKLQVFLSWVLDGAECLVPRPDYYTLGKTAFCFKWYLQNGNNKIHQCVSEHFTKQRSAAHLTGGRLVLVSKNRNVMVNFITERLKGYFII
jgi:hypothetical protein